MTMKKDLNIYIKPKNLIEVIRVFIFIITLIILIIIPAFLPLGFSPDSLNYYQTINLQVSQYNFLSFEPFYWLVVYINQLLFNANWATFVLIFSTIYTILSVYLIKKYSISPIISFIIFVLLFYPIFGLIQIRDGVSVVFIWWAFFDWLENKRLRFVIKVIIAILFHYASIVFLLALFLDKNHINKKFYFLLPLIGLLLGQYVFKIGFYQLIVNYLPDFLKFKAQVYLYYAINEINFSDINIFNAYSLFLLIVYYFSLATHLNSKYFIAYEKILGFAIFFFFSLKEIPVFSSRISNDFFTFLVFLIPYIPNKFVKNQRYLIYCLLLLILILLSWNIYIRHDLFDFSLL
jgi:hypothetical protein